jgi:hypothetical protein
VAVLAKQTLGLSKVRSGAAQAGGALCQQAVDTATGTNDPELISTATLANAEALLERDEMQRARETALQVQQSFARFGKQDSEWRAWLIAARASQRLGNEAAAHDYASHASAVLIGLEQKWGSEGYNGYLTRRDIQHFRDQLNQLLKP